MSMQYALAVPGVGSLPTARGKSTLLTLFVMFTALSPVIAVCGFMLAQILGYIPR